MNLVVKEVKGTKDHLGPEASSRQVSSVCLGHKALAASRWSGLEVSQSNV